MFAMRTVRGCLAVLLLCSGGTLANAAYLSSVVVANAYNYQPAPFNSYLELPLTGDSRSDNGVLTFEESYSFYGSSPVPMTYAVTGAAQSDYGVLRASFNTKLTNVFYSPVNPAYDGETQTGVPHAVGGQTNATFSDRLTVLGDPTLDSIRLIVSMDGVLSQGGTGAPYAAGYAALWQNYPGNYFSIIPGTYADTVANDAYFNIVLSDPFPVVGGEADVSLLLQAFTIWSIHGEEDYLTNGSFHSSRVNFFNTAKVIDVQGFDAAGNRIAVTSVVGESGTVYALAPGATVAPEPSSAALLGFGALLAGGVRRTRARRNRQG